MKTSRWIGLMLIAAMIGPAWAMGEGARTLQLHNRLRVEYDDNIRDVEHNTRSSWKIIEEVEVLVNFNLETTFISLRYKPAFVWWDNRPEDDTDLHHDLDVIFNHTFSPRLSLSIKDTLRYAELPEMRGDGFGPITREKSDYLYNALHGVVAYLLQPQTRLELSGRYNLLRYDKSDVSDREDYDMVIAGVTVRHNLVPETAVMVDARYEYLSYEKLKGEDRLDRGSEGLQFGVGTEHMFSPTLLGNARLGYHYKSYQESSISNSDEPYIDGSITFIPARATRITMGAGYSMMEADVFPYANQDRTRVFAGVAHDITARLSLNVVGSYIHSKYHGKQALDVEQYGLGGGKEEAVQISARTTYRLNQSNWLEAGWQFVTLDSDLRQDHDRNRISIGWKVQL